MCSVSAAILYQHQKLLIGQRKAGDSCPLLWEFPGGKQESNETAERCVVRECREELGIVVKPLSVCYRTVYAYPDRTVRLIFFFVKKVCGKEQTYVHNKLLWVPPDKLKQYSFCPANHELIYKLSHTSLDIFEKIFGD
ncbi:(deoxy)nucleoside triphosphate pyrophosphohydrolase [Caproicibacterium sp. XB2]|jgi:8-oxo-dGTP diphosphatase|uniref:(deoxy)nucleoside triphosphate pyrophosphohydrolase n=1 Tax=Caproicibacterium TaxID=2834348 RepID=UPI000A2964BB|nr:hypothetical protein B6259_01805 [Ruminococcaceae bacterium CPB6]MDD4807134.1 (deoxy)nucleoside triphosphate pyrophosphohydrolase [Oscillospiraceae bacterium]